ncbi:MAG: CmcJ/NvfI family oxidoreductase [Pseudomonadota bacterium]
MTKAGNDSYYRVMTNASTSAVLNYLIPTGERPIYIESQGGADAALKIGAEFEEKRVTIGNARQLTSSATLDVQGFELVEHRTRVSDFYELSAVQDQYEAEIMALVLSATGASDALVFDHTLRSDSPDVRGQRSTRETASVIHNDYTDASARQRLIDLVGEELAETRLQRRFAIINVWRSIRGTVFTSPLACCDASSLSPQDLVASERRAKERIGELELVSFNPEHRWYYFPEMTFTEALLLKTYDSSLAGHARCAIHSAFKNPLAPAGAPPRESLESRLLVFY